MYEDSKRFSWTSLFIKIIIVVIFVLFTIWLLSLSTKNATKGLSNSLNVLTDNIFKENIDRMKDVGKSYFTTERLPEKVGEVKTLTLASMYDKKLILEVKDKNGKACNAKNSYVAVEKLETEYQMKVYLECGDESNFIKVIMGCYNYCNTDICEKKEVAPAAGIEYQYSKTTGGNWTPWGNWTEWSKTSVSKNNYRDVETKVVKENYTYDKKITDSTYMGEATCPNIGGYNFVSSKDGLCTYTKTVTDTEAPSCPKTYNGYTLVSQDDFTCKYSKSTYETTKPIACQQEYNGYKLVSQDGFTCNYSKSAYGTAKPVACAQTYNGYTLVSQDGFTCNYSKSSYKTTKPLACPQEFNGYTLISQDGFTCNYRMSTYQTTTPNACAQTYSGYNLASQSGFTCNYSKSVPNKECYQVPVGVQTVTPCSGCGVQVVTIYDTKCETRYTTATTTTTVGCPTGYAKDGNSCRATTATVVNTTTTAGCPTGYTRSGDSCRATTATVNTTTTTVGCPSGYTKSGNSCRATTATVDTTTTTVGCPSGYNKSGNSCVAATPTVDTTTTSLMCATGYEKHGDICVKDNVYKLVEDALCDTGLRMDKGKCYKDTTRVEKVTDTKNVTYYRYRLREYTGGTTDYKWSTSNNDKTLLNAGYKLTGKTRNIGGK